MNYSFPEGTSKTNLDILFFANWGNRNPSPIVETCQTTYGQALTNNDLNLLAALIVEMYAQRWNKLAEIYNIEYDPIHNYLDEWEDTMSQTTDRDVATGKTGFTAYGHTETVSGGRTDTHNLRTQVDEDNSRTRTDLLAETVTNDLTETQRRTDALKEETTYGRSETRTDNLAEGVNESSSGTTSSDTDDKVVPFNASLTASLLVGESDNDGSHSDTVSRATTNTGTQTSASSGKDTVDNTGTRTTTTENDGTITKNNTGTQTLVDDNSVDTRVTGTVSRTTNAATTQGGRDDTASNGTESEDVSVGRDRSGSHSGNIGNITSQKMIAEEIALWKWKYVQEILSDVKEFCTLPVYLNATEWSLSD